MLERLGQAVLVFGAVAALDYVWALYTLAVNELRTVRAGILASGIIALSGTAAIGYVNDALMLVPAALGAFVGTVVAVRSKRS